MQHYEMYKFYIKSKVDNVDTSRPLTVFDSDLKDNAGNKADYEMGNRILEAMKFSEGSDTFFLRAKFGSIAAAGVYENSYVVIFNTDYVTGYFAIDRATQRIGVPKDIRDKMFYLMNFFSDKTVTSDMETVKEYLARFDGLCGVAEYMRLAAQVSSNTAELNETVLLQAMKADENILHGVAELIRNDL